jgi:hypothetical protein
LPLKPDRGKNTRLAGGENMPKVLDVPPILPKNLIDPKGTDVKIVDATIRQNVRTSMGLISKALVLELDVGGETYSYLFSLDRDVIGGSLGRILSRLCKIEDTDELNEKTLKRMAGKTVTVVNRGGKLYWYP